MERWSAECLYTIQLEQRPARLRYIISLAHGSLEGWEESEEGKTALESLANWYRTRQGMSHDVSTVGSLTSCLRRPGPT